MLNVMRENLRSLKWVLWLVAGSLTLYMGSYFTCGGQAGVDGGQWVALVNGEPIPAWRFLRFAQDLDGRYRQIYGESYDQQKAQFQIGTQAMRNLLEREVIVQDAQRMGLAVSQDEIAQRIKDNPSFQDAEGKYVGREWLEDALKRNYPGGAEGYVEDLESDIMVERWESVIAQAALVSNADLERLYRERNEKTAVDYVVFASADQEVATDADDAAIQSWYDAHPDSYSQPESRKVRYVLIERSEKVPQVSVSEEDLRAEWEKDPSLFTHPAQRRARHILFRLEPNATEEAKNELRQKAEQTLQRLRDGEEFGNLAFAMSEDPGSKQKGGDLGFFERGAMVPPFEKSVFETPIGELAPLTETRFGFHVIEVTDERAAGARPYEEVAPQLRNMLEMQQAQAMVREQVQRVADRVTSADLLAEVAAEEGLEVVSRSVTREERFGDIGASNEFRDTVWDLPVGAARGPLPVAVGSSVLVLDEVLDEGLQPLEAVRQQVLSDLLTDRTRKAALQAAQQASQAGGGASEIAQRLGLELRNSGDVSPGEILPGTGGNSDDLRMALFGAEVAVGDRHVAGVPAGAVFFEVTGRTAFDPVAFEDARLDLRQEVLTRKRGTMREAVIQELIDRQDVEVNDEMVQQVNTG